MYKEEKEYITIPLEEYKELLITKGKYEELKMFNTPLINKPIITYNDKPIVDPYKLTCNVGDSNE